MRRLAVLISVAVLAFANGAVAQSVFDGTWKIDMNKVDFPTKPDELLLQNGMYECRTCTPSIKVKADGSDQPVTGHPYYDSVAIKVVNGHEIQETDKKNGKVVATTTTTVSPDGKTAVFQFNDSSNSNGGAPVTGKGQAMLVAKGPAGSHAVSGSWRMQKLENLSENATQWTYKTKGDEITMTSPTGQTYTAKFNGGDAPMMGDPGVTSVEVKRMGNTLEEMDKRNGKVIGDFKFTVAPNGKTARASYHDQLNGKTTMFNAVKQ